VLAVRKTIGRVRYQRFRSGQALLDDHVILVLTTCNHSYHMDRFIGAYCKNYSPGIPRGEGIFRNPDDGRGPH
jgi:hypothetical protein